jgi:hypothetical protein
MRKRAQDQLYKAMQLKLTLKISGLANVTYLTFTNFGKQKANRSTFAFEQFYR